MTLESLEDNWANLVTCEHAANGVPWWVRWCFRGARDVLASHRGWDPGAIRMALAMAECHKRVPIVTDISRLVVDCNRSLDNPSVFSEFTRDLPRWVRGRIVRRYYAPYRALVERTIERAEVGHVVHTSVHTFTRELDGRVRAVDVGVLFDPDREPEATIGRAWAECLRRLRPSLDIRENEPYAGVEDGLTTHLRTRFAPSAYSGIEIEVCNDLVVDPAEQVAWGCHLVLTLGMAIDGPHG